jgi:hypothetical protein
MTRRVVVYGSGAGDIVWEGGRRCQRILRKVVYGNPVKVHHRVVCRCAAPGCGTILSRYHAGRYCFIHESREYKSIGRVNYHDLGKYGRGDG